MMLMRLVVLAGLGIGLFLGAASAAVLTVSPDGSGDFPTIQMAITASADGDTIELADGLFVGGGNRDIDFQGKAITVKSQGGDPLSCVIDCQGSEAEPHRGFLFHLGESCFSKLEGVTVTGGRAQQQVNGADGGGVACRNGSSPTIVACVFEANTAGGPPGGGSGGGVSVGGGTAPLLRDCVFAGNGAYHGGGLYCSPSSTAACENCQFLENNAVLGAGVMSSGGHLVIEACTFSGNTAAWDGAAICADGGSLIIESSTLSANDALFGATLLLWGVASASLENTLVVFDAHGAAVNCEGPPPWLSCCDLYGNAGGDWVGPIADQLGIRGNISEAPLFCSPAPHDDRDWTIHADSPCAPDQSTCGLIGAWGVGCDSTPVRQISWGGIKAAFGR
jgi:predicted outer membrane repeat protein